MAESRDVKFPHLGEKFRKWPEYFCGIIKLHHMKTPFILSTFLLAALGASAQVSPSWVRFPAPSNYQNYDAYDVSVGTDSLGNIYTAASSSDTIANAEQAMLVKYNAAGTRQWIKFTGTHALPAYAVTLLTDKAGNSYVCGYAQVTSNGKDYMVIKYDNAGTQLWIKYWDGGQQINDYPAAATFDHSGNIVITGSANFQGTTQDDVAMVKYSPAGVQLASYVYNNNARNLDDKGKSVACDANDNIFITGHSYGSTGREMITIKLNSSGTMQWIKTIPHASSDDESGFSIAADIAGNSYVTGASNDWLTVKYDPAGNALWTNHYTQNALNVSNQKKVLLDKFNNVIVTGDAFFGGGQFSNLVVNKLNNATGTSVWSASYNFGGIDVFRSAVLDTAGNVYVCGAHEANSGYDLTALAVSAAGSVAWNTTYTSPTPAAGHDDAYQLALDKDRNLILVGTAETRGTASDDAVDVIVLKYGAFTVGIKTNSLPEWQLALFPNPCTDYATIRAKDHQLTGAKLSLMNATGQVVLEEILSGETTEINTSHLAKGLYIITISAGEASATKKLIVQ